MATSTGESSQIARLRNSLMMAAIDGKESSTASALLKQEKIGELLQLVASPARTKSKANDNAIKSRVSVLESSDSLKAVQNLDMFRKSPKAYDEELIDQSDEKEKLFNSDSDRASEPRKSISADILRNSFNMFDIDADGFLDADEVKNVFSILGVTIERRDARRLIEKYQTSEGYLSYDDFVKMTGQLNCSSLIQKIATTTRRRCSVQTKNPEDILGLIASLEAEGIALEESPSLDLDLDALKLNDYPTL